MMSEALTLKGNPYKGTVTLIDRRILEKYIDKKSYRQLTVLVNQGREIPVTQYNIQNYCFRTGIHKAANRNANPYPDEVKFLLDNFYQLTNGQLTESINSKRGSHQQLTKSSVIHICRRLDLKRGTQIRWSAWQIRFLETNYTFIGNVQIAQFLMQLSKGKHCRREFNTKNVEKKMKLLGLKRTEDQLELIRKDNVMTDPNCWSGGKGGTSPWSTGQRTAAKDGDRRIWKNQTGASFEVIKVDGKWVHYARYRYIQIHGEIPAGMKVYHKDGELLNNEDDNLIVAHAGSGPRTNGKKRRSTLPTDDEGFIDFSKIDVF